jgi:UDP-glucose 4-epimerase
MSGGEADNVPEEVEFYERTTSGFYGMDMVLKKERPSVIFHLACLAYEGFSVFSPSHIVKHTLLNTVAILSAAIKNDVKRFVYCSSMSRYGKGTPPFEEHHEPKPVDPYGVAKVAAEEIIRQMSETHGIEYAIAVPHNIIGTNQRYDDPYRNVASIMINKLLKKERPIIYGDGEQRRSFSPVKGCVDAIMKLKDCPSGEIYNIGPGDDEPENIMSINELFIMLRRITKSNHKMSPIYQPDRPREVKVAYCSNRKMKRELGYIQDMSVEEQLEWMLWDIKRKGTKPFDYTRLYMEIEKGAPETWRSKLL